MSSFLAKVIRSIKPMNMSDGIFVVESILGTFPRDPRVLRWVAIQKKRIFFERTIIVEKQDC